jgi:hypothetical protein
MVHVGSVSSGNMTKRIGILQPTSHVTRHVYILRGRRKIDVRCITVKGEVMSGFSKARAVNDVVR